MLDLVIRGGKVVTETEVQIMDVGIEDNKIVALAHDIEAGHNEIDAAGLIILPGGIDSHVHIAQPSGKGIVMADDFASGTLSALMGGNTTVMPFCLQEKGQTLRSALNGYHALADGQCHTDISFHLIVTDPTHSVLGQEIPALVADGYSSLKVFMTYEGLRLRDDEILATLDAARDSQALVLVHCENEDAIRYLIGKHEASGRLEPRSHAETRPAVAEREATHRALSLAEIVGVPLVIVHVSNRAAMEEIQRARKRGVNVVGETCPQYLILTAEDLDRDGWEGAKFVCSPPPRDYESQRACWEGLEEGIFDLFSSDHCPFRFDDPEGKLNPRGARNFRWIPNGIPGVETRLPILFSEGVMSQRIELLRFAALTATNHAKTYGLYPRKGVIAIGADADISIWDPHLKRQICNDDLHHGADYTPYEGLEITGWPIHVILRGKHVVRNCQLTATQPTGIYLKRKRSELWTS